MLNRPSLKLAENKIPEKEGGLSETNPASAFLQELLTLKWKLDRYEQF